MLELNKIHLMNCVDGLPLLERKSVQTCVSSPPYYALRDYGIEPTRWPAITYTLFGFKIRVKAQTVCLGLEKTPQDYIGHLVHIYRLVKDALRDDGTIWVNIGDSYAANQKTRSDEQACRKSKLNGGHLSQIACKDQIRKTGKNIKPKDMMGIPWMLAFALREDGWYLRQDIIWHKLNCMPESCNDRCTKNHEYIFLLSKSKKYYYDALAIAKPVAESTRNDARLYAEDFSTNRPERDFTGNRPDRGSGLLKPMRTALEGIDTRGGNHGTGDIPPVSKSQTFKRENSKRAEPMLGQAYGSHRPDRKDSEPTALANKRSVWSLATKPFAEAHFATFPPKLIEDPIKAGTSEYGRCAACGAAYFRLTAKDYIKHENWFGDKQDARNSRGKADNSYNEPISVTTTGWKKNCKCATDEVKPCLVLDMFMGSGTTQIVANQLGRDCIGFEQNGKYIKISDKRKHKELGLLNPEFRTKTA